MRSLRQFGVLQRTDAEDAADLVAFVGRQIGVALGHHRAATLDGALDQVEQHLGLAAAALQHLAVGAEHAAVVHVHRPRRRHEHAEHLGHLEHHLQVLALRRADAIDEQRGVQTLDAVEHAGDVARGVVEATRARLHDERQRVALAVGEARHPHDLGAVALGEQSRLVEPIEHRGHQRLVVALAHDVVATQQHAELAVDDVEVVGRLVDELVPDGHGGRVGATLQQGHPSAGTLLELFAGVELRARLPCRTRSGRTRSMVSSASTPPRSTMCSMSMPNGRAPVADVVLANDGVTDELEHAHQRVADERGAQVADVHLLGHVRCRVVDDGDLGDGRTHTEVGVGCRRRRAVRPGTRAVNVRLMNPGPATSTALHTSASRPVATTASATSRGFLPDLLGRARARRWPARRRDRWGGPPGRCRRRAGPWRAANASRSVAATVWRGSAMVRRSYRSPLVGTRPVVRFRRRCATSPRGGRPRRDTAARTAGRRRPRAGTPA